MADVGSFLDFSWFVWVWFDCGFALVGCFERVGLWVLDWWVLLVLWADDLL